MSLDIVTINIAVSRARVQGADFGTLLVLARDVPWAGTRLYSSDAAFASDLALPGHAARRAVTAYFAQTPKPRRVRVANHISGETFRVRFTVDSVAAGEALAVSVTLNNGLTRTGSLTPGVGQTTVDAAEGLCNALGALGGTDFACTLFAGQSYFELFVTPSAGADRVWVSDRSARISYQETTLSGLYPARLTELASTADIYGVVIDSAADLDVSEVFAWCQANGKKFFALTQNSREASEGAPGALGTVLMGAGYTAGLLQYHRHGQRIDAALAGVALAQTWDLGTAPTLAFKTLVGQSPDTFTDGQIANVEATHTGVYVDLRGVPVTWEGRAPDGTFLDYHIMVDWLRARMNEAILNLFVQNPRVPYTTDGIELVKNAVFSVIDTLRRRGGVSPDFPIVVEAPAPSEVQADDRAERVLPDVTFDFVFVGAIHKVRVQGTISL